MGPVSTSMTQEIPVLSPSHAASHGFILGSALRSWGPEEGGGGQSGTEWLPTAKQAKGAEEVNTNILGWLTHLEAKKRGRGKQTENLKREVTCKDVFVFTLFREIHGIHGMERFEK